MVDSKEIIPPQSIQTFFTALGNDKRYKIFTLLMTGSQCNCELSKSLGIPLNLVSHHIHILIDLGLVTKRRDSSDARWIYYSIDQQVLETFRQAFMRATDPNKIGVRTPVCSPQDHIKNINHL